MKILYGFVHNNYSYLLTVQSSNLRNPTAQLETRLSRICINDNNFDSYIEIPLVCQFNLTTYRVANVATLSKNTTVHFKDRSHLEKLSNTVQTSLYISFESVSNFQIYSPLCQYKMEDIEKAFQETAIRCITNQFEVELLPSYYGIDSQHHCINAGSDVASKMTCGSFYENKYLLGRKALSSTHVFTMING